MMRRYSSPWLLMLFAYALLPLIAGCAAVSRLPPSEVISAITRERAVHFRYQARRTAYTCGGLAATLSAMLTAVGVRQVKPPEMGCSAKGTIRSADLLIHAAVLVPATLANLQAVTQHAPTERLLAHIQGRDLPTAAEVPTFPAAWTRLHLSTHGTRGLGPGDCELLEAVRDQLLPRLGVQVIGSALSCDNAASSRMQQWVSVMALLPIGEQP